MKSKAWYMKQLKRKPVQMTRYTVQGLFLLFLLPERCLKGILKFHDG
ncbi:hypothetical protein ACSU6B_11475 [Neobacillus sp. C211]